MATQLGSPVGNLKNKFACQIDNLKKAQRKYEKLISANQQLGTQMNENTMVKEELDLVKDDNAVVYKFAGPILIRQSVAEARANVDNRIKYIQSEVKKNKDLLETYKAEVETNRTELRTVEEQLQKMIIKQQLSGS